MSDGLGYTVTVDAVAQTGANDIIVITAATDVALIIDKIVLTQETQTSSEALAVQAHRASAAGAGTAITPKAIQSGYPAAGSTAHDAATTDSTATDILVREGWNVLAPFVWHPTPEERMVISPGLFWAVRLDVAPAASMTFSCVVSFREIGG